MSSNYLIFRHITSNLLKYKVMNLSVKLYFLTYISYPPEVIHAQKSFRRHLVSGYCSKSWDFMR